MFKTICSIIILLFHPVHVTITSIDYAPENNTFKVFVRMYFDDFVSDCKKNYPAIDFSSDNSVSKEAMEDYLKTNLVLLVNEKMLSGKLENMNLSENEISVNLVYKGVRNPKTVTVKNFILTKLYADQSNMLIVKVNSFEEGVKLTPEKAEQTFNIN